MKVKIDANACTGCGLCEATCGEVFEMDGDLAVVKDHTVPEKLKDDVQDAAEGCPVQAIIVED